MVQDLEIEAAGIVEELGVGGVLGELVGFYGEIELEFAA